MTEVSPESSKRPLVTFALFAYNQEKYIREAVEGAFSQTYSPLEIILSDDCSTDRTFEIMREMAASYQGPHKIILNRNERNLFIGGHMNKVFGLATGDLIVMAAGDDISLPERSSILVQCWEENNRPDGIGSAVEDIDQDGKTTGSRKSTPLLTISKDIFYIDRDYIFETFRKVGCFYILGASSAWSRKTWVEFGSIEPRVRSEDVIFALRAALLSGIVVIEKKLVQYRSHLGSATNNNIKYHETKTFQQSRTFALRIVQEQVEANAILTTLLGDLNCPNLGLDRKLVDVMRNFLLLELKKKEKTIKWWDLGVFDRLFNINCSPFRMSLFHSLPSIFGLNAYSALRTIRFKLL